MVFVRPVLAKFPDEPERSLEGVKWVKKPDLRHQKPVCALKRRIGFDERLYVPSKLLFRRSFTIVRASSGFDKCSIWDLLYFAPGDG